MSEAALAPPARTGLVPPRTAAIERGPAPPANVEAREASAIEERRTAPAPRHDLEAERAVLGAVLLDNAALSIAQMHVRAADFYHPAHAVVFESMVAIAARSEPVDVLTLRQELTARRRINAVGGLQFLGELPEATPTIANVEQYASIVAELAAVRRLGTLGQQIAAWSLDPSMAAEAIYSKTSEALSKIVRTRAATNSASMSDEIEAIYRDIEREQDPTPPRATSVRDLDELLDGGLRPDQLVILAARPAMGKSSLAQQIAVKSARRSGKPVLFFSLEMRRRELVLRVLSAEADVDVEKLRDPKRMDEDEFKRMSDAGARLYELPIVYNDTKELSLTDVRSIVLQHIARHGELELIVIDYLQLMQIQCGRDDNRARAIGDVTRGLKVLAGVACCPIIVLSQLNRDLEKRNDKRPLLADLRESGSIEQDADLVMFIYRDEVYDKQTADKGIAEIILAKHRGGPTGTVRTRFRGERTTFLDLDESEEAQLAELESTTHPRTARTRGRARRRNTATPLEEESHDDV
jgi:replicative DNA helicase